MSGALESLKSSINDFQDQLPNWTKYVIIAAGGLATAYYIKYKNSGMDRPIKKDFVKDRVYVYQFPRCRHLPSISPFSLKLETWLRMAGIDYENIDRPDLFSIRSSEGTMPFVEFNGREYPDSGFIIRDLTQIFNLDGMMAHLSDAERGQLRAIDAMTEGSLLSSYAYFRYAKHLEEVFGAVPIERHFSPLHLFMWKMWMPFMKSSVMKRMKMNPTCKHSEEEISNITNDDLRALSDILGDKPYFFGSKPTRTDACVFAIIAQIHYLPIALTCKHYLTQNAKNLIEHCERIKSEYWRDWDQIITGFAMNTHRV